MKLFAKAIIAAALSAQLMTLPGDSLGGDRPGLEPARVEDVESQLSPVPRSAVAGRSQASGQLASEDPIANELRFQRALADALKGHEKAALQTLSQDNDTAAKFARAMLLLESGAIDEGVSELEAIRSRLDAPKQVEKFLAVGYMHLNRFREAEDVANAYLLRVDEDPYVDFMLGLAIARQHEPNRAFDALKRAGYDDGEVAKIQQAAMQVPIDIQQRTTTTITDTWVVAPFAEPPPPKRLNFTLLTAGEYDSNVALQPQFSGLGANAIDREDYRFLIASFLDFQLLTRETQNVGLVGSTFNTFQVESGDFDLQDYMLGAYGNALLSERWLGSIRYEFHHTLVARSQFSNEHRLTPSLTRLGTRGHTTAFYEFNPIDSRAPALIPAQIQTASINRVGLTQAFYTFEGNGRIYAGYQYADARADGSDFDRTTHMVTGRLEQPIGYACIADLDVRYVWDDYDNPNSLDFFDRPRDDERLEVRAGLQRNFKLPISLRLDYTYINNDSNTENLFGVRFYDYDRHIFSTQLIFSL